MTTIHLINLDGSRRSLEAQNGHSLMELIRNAGVEELLALCGGCCSCATCHVQIDDASLSKLPAMSADENDLLDGSSHRNANSRLSCQVLISSQLDGMTVSIVEAD